MRSIAAAILGDLKAVRELFILFSRARMKEHFPQKPGMWTLDPIDGTKGFLRGEQYAVCLALIVDSQVQVGVIGCPNLPYDWDASPEQKGVLFVAVKGQGAEQVCLVRFRSKGSTARLYPFGFSENMGRNKAYSIEDNFNGPSQAPRVV